VFKKSLTAPTGRTPQPEYLIARSQLTKGSVGIRSHLNSLMESAIPSHLFKNIPSCPVLLLKNHNLKDCAINSSPKKEIDTKTHG